jgi:hypothetical protein
MWLRVTRVGGYNFLPLSSIAAITQAAAALRNCLRTYGDNLAHNRADRRHETRSKRSEAVREAAAL